MDTAQQIWSEAIHAAIPDMHLMVSGWADTYRYVAVGPEAGAHWKTSRVPYLKEILDCATDPNVREIVWWSCSRVAKTEGLLNNLVGYKMHVQPGPIGLVQPTLDMAQKYSRDRLATMIASTPVLTELVEDPRTRDSGNTLLHKEFPGGHISIVGANSPVGLASEDFQLLLLDEVDRFPLTAGDEGDPVELARVRTTNFEYFNDALVVQTSSPTIRGKSRIEKAYALSDQRNFYVPCTRCGEFQLLIWANVIWKELNREPKDACYRCPACKRLIEHEEKSEMMDLGEWRAQAPFTGVAGFKLTGLYSPWSSWGQMAVKLTEAKRTKNIPQLQVWTNTRLGELWEEGDGIDVDEIKFHREDYAAEVPAGVLLITAGIDTQDDRLEVEILGHGMNQETWSIDYRVLPGDTSQFQETDGTRDTVWDDLEDYLLRDWQHELGVTMRVRIAAIDRRGHSTDAVDQFCKRNTWRGWVAIQGSTTPGQPIAPRKAKRIGKLNIKVYSVGTETAKDKLAAALKIGIDPETNLPDGQGLCHFPADREEEYFDQLTSEHAVRKLNSKKYSVRAWAKIRGGARNEALDCRVYALFGKELLKPDFDKYQKHLLSRVAALPSPTLVTRPEPDDDSGNDSSDDSGNEPNGGTGGTRRPAAPPRFRVPRARPLVNRWR